MQRHRFFLQFKRDEKGIAFVEFALMLPILVALFMATIEVTRYILVTQKVQKVSMTIANVVAQAQTITSGDLDNIIVAASQIMQPFTFGANGYVTISSVTQNGAPAANNPPTVNWQHSNSGGMNPAPASKVGVKGGTAILPNNLPLNSGDNVIITEVYYNYTPLFINNGIVGTPVIYQIGLFKPRFGALNTCAGC